MKIAIVDITGRTASKYDVSLCESIAKQLCDGEVRFFTPGFDYSPEGYKLINLINLVPSSLSSSSNLLKRLLRFFETTLNYFYLIILLVFYRPSVIHFQWLPFMEFTGLELLFVPIIRKLNPKALFFLTVHNIYPHDMDDKNRPSFKRRMMKIDKYITGYFVHLYCIKKELAKDFGINDNRIFVTYHGIFDTHRSISENKGNHNEKLCVILYGYQSYYKGTDLLIEAIEKLDDSYRERLECTIIGRTELSLYEQYAEKAQKLGIHWINRYVSDDELYDAIEHSDLILLPYREISQSGVLLLALSYQKPIITSDLDSFKETLSGYPEECFFKNGSTDALALLLKKILNNQIEKHNLISVVNSLKEKYSWKETAKSTINAYKYLTNKY